MLEKPLYTHPNPKKLIELAIKGAIEEEKTYGPVFRDLYIKYALQYAAKKFGETPKGEIKTLDQILEFLVSISDRHPDALNAVVYSGSKAESELQGRSGAAARIGLMGLSKNLVREPSGKERNVDVDQLLATYQKTLLQLEVANCEVGYRKNSDESVDVIWPNCHMKDGCRMAYDEGALKRAIGGLQCLACAGMLQILKLLSGFDWDYELLEFDKPYCLARVFMV
ncbi:MAG: hypothetical protein QXV37_00975 [Candidatus Jordarchaeaceae archaeon]